MNKKVIVVSLDGTPYSLIKSRMSENPSSIWHTLVKEGSLSRIKSSRPEVSSVAWASYLTATNPGQHNLFGFVDRNPNPFRLYFPTGANLKVPTIFEEVSNKGGKVISVNVPATFPPKDINGLVIGGFLGVNLKTNVKPLSWLSKLEADNYIIDVDPGGAYQNKEKFLNDLSTALDKRIKVTNDAMSSIDWNIVHLHIMETDRLFHFFWDRSNFHFQSNALLNKVDKAVESFYQIARSDNADFVLMSDHGFTRAKRIFFINSYLRERGYLKFDGNISFANISHRSTAYALMPGRIFISLKGRESFGSVINDLEYNILRESLKNEFLSIVDPLTNQKVFTEVRFREEVYEGEYVHNASDLIAFPAEGYDIKADLDKDMLFSSPSTLVGTHTFDNAFFYHRPIDAIDLEEPTDIAEAGLYVRKLLNI